VLGGFAASSNQVAADLLSNTITNNNGTGITVGSGLDNSSNNDVAVTIHDNTLENNTGPGIVTYGGIGAFAVAYALMRAVKLTGTLRVSEEGELEGIDIHEHGAPAYHPESAYMGKGL